MEKKETELKTKWIKKKQVGISTLGLDGILYLLGVRDREAFKEIQDDSLNEVLLNPQSHSRI